ncbi:hypothetical protein UFOVP707_21 [uncultured Caudovirales phage]|uniref:Uncharacterized protein n=1 Tax=uncultured Caudovirales phage TaxID=2100421 RepID=A0A6J5NLX6_9CAUD|nr:hypothetical protein UFOVP707_21 [uncultured Caudovirales phage]
MSATLDSATNPTDWLAIERLCLAGMNSAMATFRRDTSARSYTALRDWMLAYQAVAQCKAAHKSPARNDLLHTLQGKSLRDWPRFIVGTLQGIPIEEARTY